MNYATDASSIINLYNASALDVVCKVQRARLVLSPLVIGECSADCVAKLIELEEQGAIAWVDDGAIPADLYLELLEAHGLGEGETESIAASSSLGIGLCCDDRRARTVAANIIGRDRIIGSAGLLRLCVEEARTDCESANGFFQAMRAAGGFLPTLARDYFCDGLTC